MLEVALKPGAGAHVGRPVDLPWPPSAPALALPPGMSDGDWQPHRVDAACAALEDLERELRAVEARRIEALLAAYDVAVADVVERFGSRFAGRSGMGARSFLKQTALLLGMKEGSVGHLLDTATEVRDNMPLTWRAFLDGRAPWRAVDVAAAQNAGLAMDRMCEYDEV